MFWLRIVTLSRNPLKYIQLVHSIRIAISFALLNLSYYYSLHYNTVHMVALFIDLFIISVVILYSSWDVRFTLINTFTFYFSKYSKYHHFIFSMFSFKVKNTLHEPFFSKCLPEITISVLEDLLCRDFELTLDRTNCQSHSVYAYFESYKI